MGLFSRAIAWFIPDNVVNKIMADHFYDARMFRRFGRYCFVYEDAIFDDIKGTAIRWRVWWRPLWWKLLSYAWKRTGSTSKITFIKPDGK